MTRTFSWRTALTGGKVVRLPQDKALIPLAREVAEAHGIPFLPLTDEGAKELPDEIVQIAEQFVSHGKLAYVEAEFFGGVGTQACVTWDAGSVSSEPLVDKGAINVALRFLSVRTEKDLDEFDTLNLGRHRATEDWIN